MAIYHFSAQVISRGRGQSAVAAAAYRSGEQLTDERTGEEKFYRREIQPDTMILAPDHSPEWVRERERLWNEVEKSEKRVNSQLAREINIALPKELTNEQQKELVRNFIQKEFVDKGMIADVAIHRDDANNPHAHVMMTTREITPEGFGPKNRDWNKKELLEQWRGEWANHANRALEREGIQERISHLSHEARGLEQLPSVHLGHVAHEMEKRGVQTERGDLNRERQEYNALVVDLQKYREEKQAIEQEKIQQQEQKQKSEKFNTAAERVDLQKASNILKDEPSSSNIKKRYEQLERWEKSTDKQDQKLRLKDENIKKASEHFERIDSFKKQIQEAEKQIKGINWVTVKPAQLKANLITKKNAQQTISNAEEKIELHKEKLNHYSKELGFSSESKFNQIKNQHQSEHPGLLEKSEKIHLRIKTERDILQKAENALNNAYVRQVASLYPDRPEMQHMSLQTAVKLNEVNKKYGEGRVVSIERIENTVNKGRKEIQKHENEISDVQNTQSRLRRAKVHLEHYEKYQAIVDKYEKNPVHKAKMLVSKSAEDEYNRAVTGRNSNKDYMIKDGISDRDDFEKQVDQLEKMEANVPKLNGQIQSKEIGLTLLNEVFKGIEQAARTMQREQQRQKQQAKGRGQGKERTRGR